VIDASEVAPVRRRWRPLLLRHRGRCLAPPHAVKPLDCHLGHRRRNDRYGAALHGWAG
jgi:hypothetical protein